MEQRPQNLKFKRIFVVRLANGTKKHHLLRRFRAAGAVHAVVLRRPTGNVAYVTFPTVEQAQTVEEESRRIPVVLHGRRLALSMADAWHARDSVPPRWPKSPSPDPFFGVIPFIEFPVDVIVRVAELVNFKTLAKMEQVSRTWRAGVLLNLRRTSTLSLANWRWPHTWEGPMISKDCFHWAITRCAPELKSIILSDLSATEDLRPQCLTITASHATGLEHLDVTGLTVLPSGIRSVAEHLSQLKTLKLGTGEGPIDLELRWVFANTQLSHFAAYETPLTGTSFSNLNASVEVLELIDTRIKPQHLAEALARCNNLGELRIERPENFSAEVLYSLSGNQTIATTLRQLTMEYCNPRDPDFYEELALEADRPTANFLELPELDTRFSIPSRLTSVTTLTLNFCGWVDNAFIIEMGQHMVGLRHLDLMGSTNIREQFALDPLGHLENLRDLNISLLHPSVGAQFLRELRRLKSLLCRDNEGVTDEDVCGLITNCLTIENVDVEGCKLVGRPLIECVQRIFRTCARGIIFVLRVGGTSAVAHRRDKRLLNVRINYERKSQNPYI